MDKLIVIISSIVFLASVPGKQIQIPDNNFLINNDFQYNFIIGSSSIEFIKGNRYTIEYGSEGWYWYNEGKYELKGGKAYLYPSKCLESPNGPKIECSESMNEAACVLYKSDTSLYYTQFLRVTSKNNRSVFTSDPKGGPNYIEFNVNSSKVKEGSKRVFNSLPVITMGMKRGITTDNVKIRKKPSADSDSINYERSIYEESPQPYVPRNTDITIIARTLNKETINAWNNYWYLVNVGINNEVWMYGEFIKFK